MNVRDLIKHLKDVDPEAEVHFAFDYGDHWRGAPAARHVVGDHWRTTVATGVKFVSKARVVDSNYHNTPKPADGETDNVNEVVVLSDRKVA